MVSATVLMIGSAMVMVALFPIVLLLTMVLSNNGREEQLPEGSK